MAGMYGSTPPLDAAPPLPTGAGRKLPNTDMGGMPDPSSHMLALQYLQQAKNNLLNLTTVFPDLADILNPTVTQLEQLVATRMADKMAGVLPGGSGAPMPPPGPPMGPQGPPMGPPGGGQGPMGM